MPDFIVLLFVKLETPSGRSNFLIIFAHGVIVVHLGIGVSFAKNVLFVAPVESIFEHILAYGFH
jgi:hypothetical protein